MQMPISGTRILSLLGVIGSFVQDLILIPDPTVSLYAKYAAIVLTGIAAAVAAAIQYGVIPELAKLKKRK